MNSRLLSTIRKELEAAANPEKAEGMKWYMKSEMPYRGVQTVPLRAICKQAFADHPLSGFADWTETVLEMWHRAKFREERYCAIELTGHKSYSEHQTMKALPMYEEMITTGAWWDYVDNIAGHRLREILVRSPKGMARRMRAWRNDGHMWKRRSSIICQLRRGHDTDLDLLFDCIEPNLADKEFFIRTAIGWALRDLAWFDLDTVESYVKKNQDRLSALSKREALKNAEKIRASQKEA